MQRRPTLAAEVVANGACGVAATARDRFGRGEAFLVHGAQLYPVNYRYSTVYECQRLLIQCGFLTIGSAGMQNSYRKGPPTEY